METPIRQARYEVKAKLVEALYALSGRPGLSKQEYLDLLDQAEAAIDEAKTLVAPVRALLNSTTDEALEARRQEKAELVAAYLATGALDAEAFANGEEGGEV